MNNENELTAALATIEKCREVSGCPAGVDLQDHLRQLAAENVGLKAAIDGVHHELYGQGFMVAGWHLNGDLHPLDSWFEENDWNPENPATDRIYAEAEARGVEKLIEHLVNNGYDSVANGVKAYMQLREGAK